MIYHIYYIYDYIYDVNDNTYIYINIYTPRNHAAFWSLQKKCVMSTQEKKQRANPSTTKQHQQKAPSHLNNENNLVFFFFFFGDEFYPVKDPY